MGAGVIGLTLAYQLSTDPRFKVRVVSKSLPIDADVDYTSQYAGANWRSVCANDDYRMIALEEATLHYFREFSKHHPELVNECMSYDFFDPREPDANDRRIVRETDVAGGEVPWFERICKRFHTLPKEDLRESAFPGYLTSCKWEKRYMTDGKCSTRRRFCNRLRHRHDQRTRIRQVAVQAMSREQSDVRGSDVRHLRRAG